MQVEKHWKSYKADLESFHLKLGMNWLLLSCVANMDFSKSIYRKVFLVNIKYTQHTAAECSPWMFVSEKPARKSLNL